jgi:hemoglobin
MGAICCGPRDLSAARGVNTISDEDSNKIKAGLQKFVRDNDEGALREVFKIFDRSHTGHVTGENLLNIITYSFGDFISPSEVREMVVEADTDKNNTIELEEFVQVMKKHRAADADPKGWGRLKLFDQIGG